MKFGDILYTIRVELLDKSIYNLVAITYIPIRTWKKWEQSDTSPSLWCQRMILDFLENYYNLYKNYGDREEYQRIEIFRCKLELKLLNKLEELL